jgi:hypothetical protein
VDLCSTTQYHDYSCAEDVVLRHILVYPYSIQGLFVALLMSKSKVGLIYFGTWSQRLVCMAQGISPGFSTRVMMIQIRYAISVEIVNTLPGQDSSCVQKCGVVLMNGDLL